VIVGALLVVVGLIGYWGAQRGRPRDDVTTRR
jgi:hypothetical protein